MKFMKLKSGILTAFLILSNTITEIVSKISESGAVDGINANANADKLPEFSTPIKNITVPLGREAVLTCSVTDLGNYRVGWIKVDDNTVLTLHTRTVTHNNRISVTHDNDKLWQLHIRQIRKDDKGCYMCQINTSVMRKQFGCIDVHIPPDISDQTISEVTVKEGENATLQCKAMGHPKPKITWKREGGVPIILRKSAQETVSADTIEWQEEIHLVKSERRQMGPYLCIARNDVPPAVSKRVTLNINFPPVIKVRNQLVGAPLDTDVTLECFVEGFPQTLHYWYRTKGNQIIQGAKYKVVENKNSYKTHLKLTVLQLTENDLGTYTCTATNTLGRAEGTVRIYEMKIPTTTPTTTTTTTVATTTKPPPPTTTTTTIKPTTTKFVIPSTYPSRKNSYNEKYQKNSRIAEETEKNAKSLTDSSHSKTRSTEFKLVNHSTRITFRTIFIFASFLCVVSATR